jgi:hypothetical protein
MRRTLVLLVAWVGVFAGCSKKLDAPAVAESAAPAPKPAALPAPLGPSVREKQATACASWTPAQREAYLRIGGHTQDAVDGCIDGAPVSERAGLELVSYATAAEELAKTASDGSELSVQAIAGISRIMQLVGLPMVDKCKKTTMGEAKKDPGAERGKALSVTGRVIEIHGNGGLFDGGIATDGVTIVHFETPMSTRGIVEGSYVTFRGVFVQEYAYKNVTNGQTRSVALVGAFDLPENRKGSLVPGAKYTNAPPAATPAAVVHPGALHASPHAAAGASVAPATTGTQSPIPATQLTPEQPVATATAAGKMATSTASFDRAAATGAVARVDLSSCGTDSAFGVGHAFITFAPDGSVSKVELDGGKYPGSDAAPCITGKLKQVRVPPYDGGPVRVSKSFALSPPHP